MGNETPMNTEQEIDNSNLAQQQQQQSQQLEQQRIQERQNEQKARLQNHHQRLLLEHVQSDPTLLNSKTINAVILHKALKEAEKAVGKKLQKSTTLIAPNLNGPRNRQNQPWLRPRRT